MSTLRVHGLHASPVGKISYQSSWKALEGTADYLPRVPQLLPAMMPKNALLLQDLVLSRSGLRETAQLARSSALD